MGNRAVITFRAKPKAKCVYVHWNGGRASIEGFLLAAKNAGLDFSKEDDDAIYALRDLIQPFFGKYSSVAVDTYEESDTDNMDNGVYVIDKNFSIIDRKFFDPDMREEINPDETKEVAEVTLEKYRAWIATKAQAEQEPASSVKGSW